MSSIQSPQSLSSTRTTRSSTRRINEDAVLEKAAATAKKVLLTTTEAKKRRGRPPKPPGLPKKKQNTLNGAASAPTVMEVVVVNYDVDFGGDDGGDEDPNPVPPNIIPVAGNQKFTDHETKALLKVLRFYLPCDKAEWENVAVELNKIEGVHPHLYDNLRRKYNALSSSKALTGDPNIPDEVFQAKEIKQLMFNNLIRLSWVPTKI
jgi:hypothetical protein